MSEPIGDLVDSLGITHSPDEGELVSDAIVLLKVTDPDGQLGLRFLRSDGLSWIEAIGILRVAEQTELDDLRDGND